MNAPVQAPPPPDAPEQGRDLRAIAAMVWHWVRRRLSVPIQLFARTAQPFGLLLIVFLGGTLGFWMLGRFYGQDWSLLECAFMTSITLTTVGYGDTIGVSQYPGGKIYVMILIVSGMGATLYSVSSLTAFFVEGYLGRLFREARMERIIEGLRGHTIICGAGATGTHVIEEHAQSGADFVVIDSDRDHLEHALDVHGQFPYIEGDATDEEVLRKAGIERANKLVAVLGNDKDNLFLVVTARYVVPELIIIAKCVEHDSVGKFNAAGASHVVSPTYIGGMRIASQALRPHVVDFLDAMLRTAGEARVAECTIEEGSELAGKRILESRIGERVGLLVVAMKRFGERDFVYSPASDTVLSAGAVIVVIGPLAKVQILEKMARRT